jgi:hypothetical protein
MQAWESGWGVTSPSGKWKACSSGITVHRRTLSKQSLQSQGSVKLNPEICINNAASNSRLTAAGRQATTTDSHSQTCLQTFFFSFPTFDKTTTVLHLHAEKLTETVLHLNLGNFVGFFLCLCSFVQLYVSPLMRQLQNNIWGTISRIGGWETSTKIIKTETSLDLNLEVYFYFYFIF